MTAGPAGAGDRADGTAAAQAVEAYERAWRDASYEAFTNLVTADFARDLGIADAADFRAAAADFAESSAGLTSQVTGFEVVGERATVVTTETSLDGADHVIEKVAHRLVRTGGAWRVDAIEAFDG